MSDFVFGLFAGAFGILLVGVVWLGIEYWRGNVVVERNIGASDADER